MNKCSSCYGEIEGESLKCSVCSGMLHKDCAINDGAVFCDTCYTEKETKKEELKFDIPDIIRRSYIKQYDDCPYQFYGQHALGIEQKQNIYSQMGIDLHELFEKGSKDGSYHIQNMKDDFRNIFDGYSDKLLDGLYGNTSDLDMYQKGVESIENFYNIIAELPGEMKSAEKKYVFEVGEGLPKVQATIDRVDLVDGKLHVLDWKTGNVMVGKNLSSDLQPPLYIAAVQKEYGLTVEKFTLHYLSENKFRIYERINDDNYVCKVGKREYKINITDTIRKVQHIFSQIKKGNFNIPVDTKGMFYTCKMCHVKKAGKCEGAETQVWSQFNK